MISVPSSFATHTSVTSLSPPALCRTTRTMPIAARLAGLRRVGTGPQGQPLADGAVPGAGLGQREVGLDVVAVAAAVLFLDHVAGLDQVRDDAERAAFGDVQAGRDVAQADPGIMGDQEQNPR